MDGLCPVCEQEVESIYHALFKCAGVKNVWELWKECPMVLGAENMDFSDLALKMLECGTSRDWSYWLWLLGQFGVVET